MTDFVSVEAMGISFSDEAWMVEHALALKWHSNLCAFNVYLKFHNKSIKCINPMLTNYGCIKILLTRASRRVLGHKTLEKRHLY